MVHHKSKLLINLEIEKRDDLTEEEILQKQASARPINTNTARNDDDDAKTEEEDENLILGASAVALAANVVVIRKRVIQHDVNESANNLYELLVNMIQDQIKINQTKEEQLQVSKQLEKITTYATTHHSNTDMLRILINLVKLSLHCLSYLCKRIISTISNLKYMILPQKTFHELKNHLLWKDTALQTMEQYRVKLPYLKMIELILEPIALEIQEYLDDTHAILFEGFHEACMNILKKNQFVRFFVCCCLLLCLGSFLEY